LSDEVLVWQQPDAVPLPADLPGVRAVIAALRADAAAGPSPRFADLARLMNGRFPLPPDAGGAFAGGPLDGRRAPAVWPVPLLPGPQREAAMASLVTWAMALGLNVADLPADSVWFSDGRILSPDPAALCLPAFGLYHGGDHAGAWTEFVALGRFGNPAALRQLATMVEDGELGPPNLPLALALLHLGGHGGEAEALAVSMRPAQCDTAMRLLERLHDNPGLFGQIVETALRPAPLTAAAPPPAAPVPAPPPAEDLAAPQIPRLARPPVQRRAAPVDDRPPSAGVDAVLAMVVGALALPLWWVAGHFGGDWVGRGVLLLCLGAGAWGVWQGGLARGWDVTQSGFHAALAAVPVLGWLPIWRVLLRKP
jgi:hypothetical protein